MFSFVPPLVCGTMTQRSLYASLVIKGIDIVGGVRCSQGFVEDEPNIPQAQITHLVFSHLGFFQCLVVSVQLPFCRRPGHGIHPPTVGGHVHNQGWRMDSVGMISRPFRT